MCVVFGVDTICIRELLPYSLYTEIRNSLVLYEVKKPVKCEICYYLPAFALFMIRFIEFFSDFLVLLRFVRAFLPIFD